MKRLMVLLVAAVMVIGFAAQSQATLTVVGVGTIGSSANNGTENMVNGGYELIYDSGLNVTWLDYTATYSTWQNQVNWANNLVVNFNGKNLTGWSLPTTVDNYNYSYGLNPPSNSSQMAYLYYTDLGNTGYPNNGYGLNNVGPFKNLYSYPGYWSGTQYSANPGLAWDFGTDSGGQGMYGEVNGNVYGLAVLPGDPAATPIPAPAYLFGSGLLGLVGIRKKMQK
jgi:hypothetical protein